MIWSGVIDHNWRKDAHSSDVQSFIIDGCLPLLSMMRDLACTHNQVPLTLSLGASTIDTLLDPSIQKEVHKTLDDQICDLKNALKVQDDLRSAIHQEIEWKQKLRALYRDVNGCLVTAYAKLRSEYDLEIMTSIPMSTQLPQLISIPGAVRLQFEEAINTFERAFQFRPKGIHLLRSGFMPSFEALVVAQGFEYCVVDARAFKGGSAPVVHSVYAPIHTPNGGLRVLAPDEHSLRLPASRKEHFHRFYRDCGQHPLLKVQDSSSVLGLSRYQGTSNTPLRYDRQEARDAIVRQANAYVQGRLNHGIDLRRQMDKEPIMVVDFDVLKFANQWREGPAFIAEVIGQLSKSQDIDALPLSRSIERLPINQTTWPGPVVDSSTVDEMAEWRVPRLYEAARLYRQACKVSDRSTGEESLLDEAKAHLTKACQLPTNGAKDRNELDAQIACLRHHLDVVVNCCQGMARDTSRHVEAKLEPSEPTATVAPHLLSRDVH